MYALFSQGCIYIYIYICVYEFASNKSAYWIWTYTNRNITWIHYQCGCMCASTRSRMDSIITFIVLVYHFNQKAWTWRTGVLASSRIIWNIPLKGQFCNRGYQLREVGFAEHLECFWLTVCPMDSTHCCLGSTTGRVVKKQMQTQVKFDGQVKQATTQTQMWVKLEVRFVCVE